VGSYIATCTLLLLALLRNVLFTYYSTSVVAMFIMILISINKNFFSKPLTDTEHKMVLKAKCVIIIKYFLMSEILQDKEIQTHTSSRTCESSDSLLIS